MEADDAAGALPTDAQDAVPPPPASDAAAPAKPSPMFAAEGPAAPKRDKAKLKGNASLAAVARPSAPAPKTQLPPLVEAKNKAAAAKALGKAAEADILSAQPLPPVIPVMTPSQAREPTVPSTPSSVVLQSAQPIPPPHVDDMSGWSTLVSDDGETFYFHDATRTTALHQMGGDGAAPSALVETPWAEPGPGAKCLAADPSLPWNAADWDIVLVLPLPEGRAAAAEAAAEAAEAARLADTRAKGGDSYDEHLEKTRLAREKAKREKEEKKRTKAEAKEEAKLQKQQAKGPKGGGGEGDEKEFVAIDAGEMKLRKGLQLEMLDAPCDEAGGRRSSTGWLLKELRRRVLDAGLQCKVLYGHRPHDKHIYRCSLHRARGKLGYVYIQLACPLPHLLTSRA